MMNSRVARTRALHHLTCVRRRRPLTKGRCNVKPAHPPESLTLLSIPPSPPSAVFSTPSLATQAKFSPPLRLWKRSLLRGSAPVRLSLHGAILTVMRAESSVLFLVSAPSTTRQVTLILDEHGGAHYIKDSIPLVGWRLFCVRVPAVFEKEGFRAFADGTVDKSGNWNGDAYQFVRIPQGYWGRTTIASEDFYLLVAVRALLVDDKDSSPLLRLALTKAGVDPIASLVLSQRTLRMVFSCHRSVPQWSAPTWSRHFAPLLKQATKDEIRSAMATYNITLDDLQQLFPRQISIIEWANHLSKLAAVDPSGKLLRTALKSSLEYPLDREWDRAVGLGESLVKLPPETAAACLESTTVAVAFAKHMSIESLCVFLERKDMVPQAFQPMLVTVIHRLNSSPATITPATITSALRILRFFVRSVRMDDGGALIIAAARHWARIAASYGVEYKDVHPIVSALGAQSAELLVIDWLWAKWHVIRDTQLWSPFIALDEVARAGAEVSQANLTTTLMSYVHQRAPACDLQSLARTALELGRDIHKLTAAVLLDVLMQCPVDPSVHEAQQALSAICDPSKPTEFAFVAG
jgi:hypothetical protein